MRIISHRVVRTSGQIRGGCHLSVKMRILVVLMSLSLTSATHEAAAQDNLRRFPVLASVCKNAVYTVAIDHEMGRVALIKGSLKWSNGGSTATERRYEHFALAEDDRYWWFINEDCFGGGDTGVGIGSLFCSRVPFDDLVFFEASLFDASKQRFKLCYGSTWPYSFGL